MDKIVKIYNSLCDGAFFGSPFTEASRKNSERKTKRLVTNEVVED